MNISQSVQQALQASAIAATTISQLQSGAGTSEDARALAIL